MMEVGSLYNQPHAEKSISNEIDIIEVLPVKATHKRDIVAIAALIFAIVALFLAVMATSATLYMIGNERLVDSMQDSKLMGLPMGNTRILWYDPAKNATNPRDIPGYNKRSKESTTAIPGVPTLGYTLENGTKVFHIYAQPVNQVIYDNADYETLHRVIPQENRYRPSPLPNIHNDKFSLHAWGYNGQHPGPLIEVNQYDIVRVVLHNELVEPTSLHFHGLVHSWEMDGTGGVSQQPVQPGENFTYEFRVNQCGTFFYHSGTFTPKQLSMGLTGPFVSHCYENEPAVNIDIYILLSAFEAPDEEMAPTPQLFPDDANLILINGKSAPSIPVWIARQGDVIRFRMSDPMNNMHPHPMHLHGHTWKIYAIDGGQVAHDPNAHSTMVLTGGKTFDVIFQANPGVWKFHCHLPSHMVNRKQILRKNPLVQMEEGGMFTYLCVEGQTQTMNITCPKTE